MSVEGKIQALIDVANDVTGESREDLTSAIQDLVDMCGIDFDGKFYPMNMTEYVLPTMTLTYNGSEI